MTPAHGNDEDTLLHCNKGVFSIRTKWGIHSGAMCIPGYLRESLLNNQVWPENSGA